MLKYVQMLQRFRWVLCCLCLWSISNHVIGHGLEITSVTITKRHEHHLTIEINTPLQPFIARMQWQGKPPSLLHLASATEDGFNNFYDAMQSVIEGRLNFLIGGQPLESIRHHIPTPTSLQSQLQRLVAGSLIHQKTHDYNNGHRAHDNDLSFVIEGFIPSLKEADDLIMQFPDEFGSVTVSYSVPQVQTVLSKGEPVVIKQRIK